MLIRQVRPAASGEPRQRFEQIAAAPENNDDPFVGDKLSPDLRKLTADAGQNRTVKVILQSDDIDNSQLLNVHKRNNIVIESQKNLLCKDFCCKKTKFNS